MDALTNDQISNQNPSKYLFQFLSENESFGELLKSHFISLNGYGLEDDDFHNFLNSRSTAVFEKIKSLIIPTKLDTIRNDLFF